jgi:hypothetical protein
MPSPARYYELDSDDQLAAIKGVLIAERNDGTITSLGGAAKSSSLALIPVEIRLQSLAYEFRLRGLAGKTPRQSTTYVDMSGYK